MQPTMHQNHCTQITTETAARTPEANVYVQYRRFVMEYILKLAGSIVDLNSVNWLAGTQYRDVIHALTERLRT